MFLDHLHLNSSLRGANPGEAALSGLSYTHW
jgi:hypothetical protein